MATYSVTYNNVWKWLQFDWWTPRILYWADFNPTDQSDYSADHCTVYDATTSFNLSWFQPWNEVWAATTEFQILWPIQAGSTYLYMDFYRSSDWNNWGSPSRTLSRRIDWPEMDEYHYTFRRYRIYFWVDKDEIWPWYNYYKAHRYTVDGKFSFYSPTFTISNLSIDSSLHKSWYLWVNWNNLCYTDNTWDEIWQNWYWYKHRIAYDSSYSSSVGSDKAGHIRLDSSDLLRIYYVDEYWIRRRTYPSNERYWGNVNVWSSRSWYMWVWINDATQWYWYLCFVWPNWSKRRILNWPPAWYV